MKGNWDPSQDMVILKIVKEKGKKWAFIASELKGQKNEHMVKNRYNSLLRKKKNAVRLRD